MTQKEEDFLPYFVSGSSHLTAEDLFQEKTLELSHAGGDASDGEQLSHLIGGFTSFLKETESKVKDLPSDQQLSLLLAGWQTFSSLYIAEHSAFGTTVGRIDKEVLLALKEGKPVIIDEINTIAMQNLIALNDILQHHAGQTAYITGVGMVTIRDGFCLIGTGNLSTGTVSYEGTNALNPAFQSRFTTIVYNYVPQNTEGELEDQKDPEKNELFRMMIEHLCSGDGTLMLPEPAVTLKELFHLAEMARVSQNMFEGKSSTVREDGDTPVLNESVLSIRNLIHVLDHWNFGEEEDLSMALWNGFLSSVTNADDRNLLLALAARYGFFPESEGWHIQSRARGEGALSYDEIRTGPDLYEIRPLETLSREDVVQLLFGSGPKRTSLPEEFRGEIVLDEASEKPVDLAESLDEEVRHLERSAQIMKKVAADAGTGDDRAEQSEGDGKS